MTAVVAVSVVTAPPLNSTPLFRHPDLKVKSSFLRAGTAPILNLKKRSENGGGNDNPSCGFPSIPGIARGVAPRIAVFVLLKSWDAIPRMEFRIPRMEF